MHAHHVVTACAAFLLGPATVVAATPATPAR